MTTILLLLLASLLALSSLTGLRRFLATCYAGVASGAVSARKSKLISDQTALSADTDEATLGQSGCFDTRGMKNIAFRYNCSAITGGVADTNYFQVVILGAESPSGTFTEVAYLRSGQIIAVGSGQIPDAAAEFPVLPRYIKVRHDETGAVTGYACKVWMEYEQDWPGIQHKAGYQGG